MYAQFCLGLLLIIITICIILKNTEKYTKLPNVQVITYATHEQGMYQDLINNKFNIPIKTLGFGTKWKGFTDKIKGVRNYLDTCEPDSIVIFVDGFDSEIVKPLDVAIQRFLDYDTEILLSLDQGSHDSYMRRQVFGSCDGKYIINSGLYMGYVRTLKRFLNFINNKNYSTDDQRNFNQACKTFQNMIKLDTKQTVFNNLAPHNLERLTSNFTNLDTCFVQLPGEISYDRVIRRGIKEYYPFIKKEVDWIVSLCLAIIFAIVAIIFFIKYFKNNPI
jgi:hypothetical protein